MPTNESNKRGVYTSYGDIFYQRYDMKIITPVARGTADKKIKVQDTKDQKN